MITRRPFLFAPALAAAQSKRAPRLLLRNFWQTVNIGDAGHGPGALSLLSQLFPEAQLTLWPRRLDDNARRLLTNYPNLTIVEGTLDKNGRPSTPQLAQAFQSTDLYISGSGSGFPDSAAALAFLNLTNKPLGVFGVSTDPISGFGNNRRPEGGTLQQIQAALRQLPPTHLDANTRSVIDRAAFFFCRDSISVDYLRRQQVKAPILEFGPDSQLGMHLRDDAKADAFLQANQLTPGQFICVIPRLRYTPYYRIDGRPRTPDDDVKDAINNRTTEQDHAKLRALITSYLNANPTHKVFAAAEMTYQLQLAKEVLVDPLPQNLRSRVVWRDSFWGPDEAASVYARAACVISVECHSPLIALRHGTPTFYVRQPTDTCKGQMYRDIGAHDWFFEIDETSGDQLWQRLQPIIRNPRAAKAKVQSIMATVQKHQRRMVDAVRRAATVNL